MTLRGAFLGALLLAAASAQTERPNILWIVSEDHGPQMGCYGDAFATTPHVDALAAKGMLFRLAWSTAPVCAPAKTTIISGMYPPAFGGQHMRSMVPLPSHVKLFSATLRELGYDVDISTIAKDFNARPANGENEARRKASRVPKPPFLKVVRSPASHESRIRKRPHEPVHDAANVRIPAYHPDNAESRQDWAQYYDVVTRSDANAGRHLANLEKRGRTGDTIVFYCGDHGSGMSRSKRWTYNSGLHVPMVVYFPPKWRHLAPKEYEPGAKSDRMVGFIDMAPTFLSLAGVKPPAWMQGHAFAGRHQVPPPRYMFGFRGRMDERYDFIRTVTDGRFHYIRNYNPHLIYGQHVRYNFQTPSTAAWKRDFDAGKLNDAQSAFWRVKPAEELYDLAADPDEVVNLADSKQHAGKLRELRGALQGWCRSIRDTGFLPEGEIHSRSRGSTPWDMAQDDERYSFDRIFAAAELATHRHEHAVPALKGLLEDDDSAVRYWGVIGLYNRGRDTVRGAGKELRAALDDPSPYVRIAAALALGKHGEPKDVSRAAELLVELAPWTPEGDVFVSITALNALDELDAKASSMRAAIQAFPRKGGASPHRRYDGYVARLVEKTLADLAAPKK